MPQLSRGHHKNFAKIRLGNFLIELGLHDLIYNVFHHFLVTVNSKNDKEIITALETIMVKCINGSDVLPQPILSMILAVCKQEWVPSTAACGLINSVFKQCEGKLKLLLNKEVQVEKKKINLGVKENGLPHDKDVTDFQDVSIDVHTFIHTQNECNEIVKTTTLNTHVELSNEVDTTVGIVG